MEISLKQRLIGAAFIIALAVIFLPMLLDGSGRREMLGLDIDIPPEPEFTFEQRLQDSGKYQQAEPQKQSEQSQPAVKKLKPADDGTAIDQKSVQPESKVAARPEPAAPKVESKPASKTASKPASKPVAAKPPESQAPPGKGWVVQVGSFSHQDNAISLRDKLRSAGFSAFIEDNSADAGSSKPIFRVKVGPEEKQANAEQLQVKLLTQEKIKGIVVSHP